eukprot:Awhi_evm1s5296
MLTIILLFLPVSQGFIENFYTEGAFGFKGRQYQVTPEFAPEHRHRFYGGNRYRFLNANSSKPITEIIAANCNPYVCYINWMVDYPDQSLWPMNGTIFNVEVFEDEKVLGIDEKYLDESEENVRANFRNGSFDGIEDSINGVLRLPEICTTLNSLKISVGQGDGHLGFMRMAVNPNQQPIYNSTTQLYYYNSTLQICIHHNDDTDYNARFVFDSPRLCKNISLQITENQRDVCEFNQYSSFEDFPVKGNHYNQTYSFYVQEHVKITHRKTSNKEYYQHRYKEYDSKRKLRCANFNNCYQSYPTTAKGLDNDV